MKKRFDAIKMTRQIREAHAAALEGKSPEEVVAFFRSRAERDLGKDYARRHARKCENAVAVGTGSR
jgi:hypothetical protein